jgi:BirA family transcriptional regulator, biotin operon repressor / biotin---[acetyl-CoA-carboxylase] ligase
MSIYDEKKPMTAWPEGYGRRILAEVGSTLDEAARIAPGLSGPEWILAHRQSAGRGRRGRAWAAPEGNFAATLVLCPVGDPREVALRSFVAALALFDACVAVTGRPEGFALKWPNDLLLNGGKLAGILLESAGTGGGVTRLSVGFGVNLVEAPKVGDVETGALRPVSLLSETGIQVEPEDFLTFLAGAYAHYEDQFTRFGFEVIRTIWLDRAARLGQVITARAGASETTGTFQTVDAGGNLVLLTSQGRVAIPAADVYF